MTENENQQEIAQINNVLEVRASAIMVAFAANNTNLYAVAVEGNDTAIAGILDHIVKDVQVDLDKHSQKLEDEMSLHDHMHVLFDIALEDGRLQELTLLRDKAKAIVELAESGQVNMPLSSKTTVELMEISESLQHKTAAAV